MNKAEKGNQREQVIYFRVVSITGKPHRRVYTKFGLRVGKMRYASMIDLEAGDNLRRKSLGIQLTFNFIRYESRSVKRKKIQKHLLFSTITSNRIQSQYKNLFIS